MSQPIRYSVDDDQPDAVYAHENGHLVKWDDYAALAAENKNLLFESERARMDWEMLAAFMFDEKLEDRFKSWHHANYDVWYRRSHVPKWRKANVGKDSSIFEKNAALAAENEQLKAAGLTLAESSDNAIWSLKQQLAVSEAKVAWLQKADRLVIWNGTEWQVRHVVEQPIKPRE